MGGFNHHQHRNVTSNSNKGSGSALVFAKRKPAFKIRIDSLCQRGIPSSSSSSSSSNSNPKKSVRFAETRNTVLFRHVLDSELRESWYASKDYCHFKLDSRGTLDAFQKAQGQLCRLDPQEHCIRGLEAHVSSGMLSLRKTKIRSTIQVVLDQQQAQRYHGVKDPTMVAAVSMMFSKHSRQHALSMGALDNSLRQC